MNQPFIVIKPKSCRSRHAAIFILLKSSLNKLHIFVEGFFRPKFQDQMALALLPSDNFA
jgi:hypothetical protein